MMKDSTRYAATGSWGFGLFQQTWRRGVDENLLPLFGNIATAMHNFVAHCHTERNHQGLANRLISPEAAILETPAWSSAASAWAHAELLLPRRGLSW